MATQRITVRVPEALGAKIRQASRVKGRTPSDLIRLAVENYLEEEPVPGSAYEAAKAAGLIGCVSHGPKDLSTNRWHFEGFGKRR
ncbi:MAG: ribbon-helix-helix protein, CopG family [Candidatus Sulfotelmatobacter sp.]